MLEQKTAEAFARSWVAAWNAHDLERILAHYADHVEFTSPTAVKLAGAPSGTVIGREALRPYFANALGRFPQLNFRLDQVLTGVGSVVLYYRSVNNAQAAELMEFDGSGLIARVLGHYMPA